MTSIQISSSLIAETIRELQEAGRDGKERVVLWIGEMGTVREAYVPEQYAERDMFRIPRASIASLLKHLRATNQHIISQVHSHPFKAFHSLADDRWAIVRHVGAFSLVLPNFALKTEVAMFRDDVAVFQLSKDNEWIEVGKESVYETIQIQA